MGASPRAATMASGSPPPEARSAKTVLAILPLTLPAPIIRTSFPSAAGSTRRPARPAGVSLTSRMTSVRTQFAAALPSPASRAAVSNQSARSRVPARMRASAGGRP